MSITKTSFYTRLFLALIALAPPSPQSYAIDNPDAPDLLGEFAARAQPYESEISKLAGTTSAVVRAYASYEKFLDLELNRVYSALARKLNPAQRQQLLQSQKKWLAFRDTEFGFIAGNWTVEQFGTSSYLSRGAYRSELIKDRTRALLYYLKNYPN